MAVTQIWRGSRVSPDDGRASPPGSGRSRGHRARSRLWALLHAQALLNGRAGTPGGDTYIIAGSYTDTLARTASGWKITERVQVYLWRDGNRAVVKR